MDGDIPVWHGKLAHSSLCSPLEGGALARGVTCDIKHAKLLPTSSQHLFSVDKRLFYSDHCWIKTQRTAPVDYTIVEK